MPVLEILAGKDAVLKNGGQKVNNGVESLNTAYSENYTEQDIPRIRKEGKTFRNLLPGSICLFPNFLINGKTVEKVTQERSLKSST